MFTIKWNAVHDALESAFTIPWKPCSPSRGIRTESRRENFWNEMADALMYLIPLTDKLNIDFPDAARHKLIIIVKKYLVEKLRNDARKYDEYGKS